MAGIFPCPSQDEHGGMSNHRAKNNLLKFMVLFFLLSLFCKNAEECRANLQL
jgi:hypothetical protein